MLNARPIKVKGKTVDVPKIRDANGELFGEGMYVAEVAVTGSQAVDLSAVFESITGVVLTARGDAAAEANYTPTLTWEESSETVTIYAWKHTSTSNPTLIAATDAATVTMVVFGQLA